MFLRSIVVVFKCIFSFLFNLILVFLVMIQCAFVTVIIVLILLFRLFFLPVINASAPKVNIFLLVDKATFLFFV